MVAINVFLGVNICCNYRDSNVFFSDYKMRDYTGEVSFLGANYERIARDNLSRLYSQLPANLEGLLRAEKEAFSFFA